MSWSELFTNEIEFLGFITGILSVGLLLFTRYPRLQYLNWPASIVSAAVYLFLFYDWKLYGNAILQIPFLLISAMGLIVWWPQLRGLAVTKQEVPTSWADRDRVFILCLAAALLTIPVYFVLRHYGDASPLWDGLILTISIAAIILQLGKYVQSWFLWIVVDLIAVPFHYSQNKEATALLYLFYGLMCVVGLYTWVKDARFDPAARYPWLREDNVVQQPAQRGNQTSS